MSVRAAALVSIGILALTLARQATGQVEDQAYSPHAAPPLHQVAPAQPMPVHNGPIARFVHSVVRDWKRNNCWPEPFVCPDRQFARQPFVTMVHNGWRRQNLLSTYHFKGETGELNPAGEEKLRWILLQAPEHHRTVYVGRGRSVEETATRVASVQRSASQIVPEGPAAAIVETNLEPGGWPAERVEAIGRSFEESAPPPRLPECSGGTETD